MLLEHWHVARNKIPPVKLMRDGAPGLAPNRFGAALQLPNAQNDN